MTRRPKALVVGAGFAGAVYAREVAQRGYAVDVIECRRHVAGNAFDETRPDGTRVHCYGLHLFHTNNIEVMRWLERFGAFMPYTHHVAAEIVRRDGTVRHVPLPINRTTINEVFSLRLTSDADVADFLRDQAVPCAAPRNAADYLHSRIGKTLTDLFFRRRPGQRYGTLLPRRDW